MYKSVNLTDNFSNNFAIVKQREHSNIVSIKKYM